MMFFKKWANPGLFLFIFHSFLFVLPIGSGDGCVYIEISRYTVCIEYLLPFAL